MQGLAGWLEGEGGGETLASKPASESVADIYLSIRIFGMSLKSSGGPVFFLFVYSHATYIPKYVPRSWREQAVPDLDQVCRRSPSPQHEAEHLCGCIDVTTRKRRRTDDASLESLFRSQIISFHFTL